MRRDEPAYSIATGRLRHGETGVGHMVNKIVLAMATLRLMSGSIEMLAALLMLRLNQIDKALAVNSSLALVGPLVLLTTTAVGLAGLADKLSPSKLMWITTGVACLLIGILKK